MWDLCDAVLAQRLVFGKYIEQAVGTCISWVGDFTWWRGRSGERLTQSANIL